MPWWAGGIRAQRVLDYGGEQEAKVGQFDKNIWTRTFTPRFAGSARGSPMGRRITLRAPAEASPSSSGRGGPSRSIELEIALRIDLTRVSQRL